MARHSLFKLTSLLLVAAMAQQCRADDILQNVPRDTLGFVVIRDIAGTDEKIQQLARNLQGASIGPLTFLQATTGTGDGLDLSGDFLLAAIPGDNGAAKPEFCIWLPVKNFDRFLTSLGRQASSGIMAITLAGEDLLIAKQGNWVVLMDPDQRARLANMLAAGPDAPARVMAWRGWIERNDVTVVSLASGVREILKLASSKRVKDRDALGTAREVARDDLEDMFGPAGTDDGEPSGDGAEAGFTGAIVAALQRSVGTVLSASPQLAKVLGSVESLGCGVKFDDAGNARLGLRVAWPEGAPFLANNAQSNSRLPPTIFDADEFIVHAAGNWPSSLNALLAGTYARLVVDELRATEGIQLADNTVNRYLEAVEQAAADVISLNVLALTGQPHDGVYTNGFVVARTASADNFVDRVAEAMRLWNQMNREAEGGPRLVFDVAEVPSGNYTAIQYSIDLAAVDGAPVIPEMRQAMERLFGAGGKLTLFLVKADGQTVLAAAATLEQVGKMLERLEGGRATDWNVAPFAEVNRLLPQQAEWRAYFSPHGYTTWSARKMDAIVGVPVIGGPLVKDFPQAPPIGAAGGIRDGEMWIDMGVPLETIQSTGIYLQKLRARGR
jgi:hypothetical protein